MSELKGCLYCGSENEVSFEYGYGFVNCTNNKCVGIGVIKENDFNEEVVDIHNNAHAFRVIEKQNKIIELLKKSNRFYANYEQWITDKVGVSNFVKLDEDIETLKSGQKFAGKLAREIKKQVEELENDK